MATTRERTEEIHAKEDGLRLGGGVGEIERVHNQGKLTSRERIDRLLDDRSFEEIDLWTRPPKTGFNIEGEEIAVDGVIAGSGRMDGLPVYVWCNDNTVLNGALGEMGIRKIVTVMEMALRDRVPIIGIYDSAGMRRASVLNTYNFFTLGRMMHFQTISSGVIPQVSLIMGPCTGALSLSANISDFVFMVKETSSMYMASFGEDNKDLGSAKMHWEKSGSCDFIANTEADCLDECKKFFSFVPSCNKEMPPVIDNQDPVDRADEELFDLVPADPRKYFDMRTVIRKVVDTEDYFEIKNAYARNLSIGFARFDGKPVGIIGNNPIWLAGCEDTDSSSKHSRFTRFCDAFNIPLVYFGDCPGFLPSAKEERRGILRHGCMVIHSTSEATVPKINIYVRKCFGGAQLAMPCNFTKADRYSAWPIVQRAIMGAKELTTIVFKKEMATADTPEDKEKIWKDGVEIMSDRVENFSIANNQLIIDPRQTRQSIIEELECTKNKVQERPWRKHENINL